ncbi:hypothetical protein QQ045_028248 [Rhodiola kirilowii]
MLAKSSRGFVTNAAGTLAKVTFLLMTSAGVMVPPRLWLFVTFPCTQLSQMKTSRPPSHAIQNTIITDCPDVLEWCRSSSGSFSTKELHFLRNSPYHIDKYMANIWRRWLPPKISVLLWKLHHRAIPFDDRVRQCGIALASKCRCCQSPKDETANHLFFNSDAANRVWDVGRALLDIPRSHSTRMLWDILNQLSCNTSYVDGLRITWICCSLWELWSLRNSRLHDERHRMDILSNVRTWIQNLASNIRMPHDHCLLHEAILKALHLPAPYVPKPRWKKWNPCPTGLTLNVAWNASGDGPFILRNNRGAVLHFSRSSLHPPLTALSHIIQ